jgi:RNA polymerase sigma factor (sigma-70 family)
MEQDQNGGRLSQISTPWTDLRQAHHGPLPALGPARRRVLMRYSTAVYRYLLGAVHDRDVADDLFQEFALRLMRGDFRGADPHRGRFSDYLKTSLGHLVSDHYRRGKAQPLPLHADVPAPSARSSPLSKAEDEFSKEWRGRLIDLTFEALEEFERQTGNPLYTVLRFREEHPKMPVAEMAGRLGRRLGRELTTEWVYKHLHQARQKFADLLLEEVAQTLDDPGPEELAEELGALGLLKWCQPALRRRHYSG